MRPHEQIDDAPEMSVHFFGAELTRATDDAAGMPNALEQAGQMLGRLGGVRHFEQPRFVGLAEKVFQRLDGEAWTNLEEDVGQLAIVRCPGRQHAINPDGVLASDQVDETPSGTQQNLPDAASVRAQFEHFRRKLLFADSFDGDQEQFVLVLEVAV